MDYKIIPEENTNANIKTTENVTSLFDDNKGRIKFISDKMIIVLKQI